MDWLETLSHFFTDFAVLFGYFWHQLFTLFNGFFSPLKWLYLFVKSVLETAFATPPSVDFNWPAGVATALNSIPYFSTFVSVVMIIFLFWAGFSIFRWISESL